MPTALSFFVCVTMIGPSTRLVSTTLRKKPFRFFEKPLCENAACSKRQAVQLLRLELAAAAVTTRPPKL